MPNNTPKRMFGRTMITTSAVEITADNVVAEIIDKAFVKHLKNRSEIDYLYKYYKGDQPILYRTKEVRPEICNKIVENHAEEIVSFKTGYLVGSPVQYVSRNNNAEEYVSLNVDKLNDLMLCESKETKDKEIVEWCNICGTAYRIVLPNKEYEEGYNAPFDIYTLDPRNTFVVYSTAVGNKPLAGVHYVVDEDNQIKTFSIYTKTHYFEIEDHKLTKSSGHILGGIPIIEYKANNAALGAFEPVITMLDAINTVCSNRLDGVEQFIQSLCVLYNAELPDGETANTIRESGLIQLRSTGDNKADIKILSEQLDQVSTQTLKDDMYNTVLKIVGMPNTGSGDTSDSSNNGAVILKNGWQSAEARAKDSELMFRKSEREFLRIALNIAKTFTDIDLRVGDVVAHFTRRQYEDIGSKASVLTMLLGSEKVAPRLAFEASNLFIDSESAYQESVAYIEKQKEEAAENVTVEEVAEEEPVTD